MAFVALVSIRNFVREAAEGKSQRKIDGITRRNDSIVIEIGREGAIDATILLRRRRRASRGTALSDEWLKAVPRIEEVVVAGINQLDCDQKQAAVRNAWVLPSINAGIDSIQGSAGASGATAWEAAITSATASTIPGSSGPASAR